MKALSVFVLAAASCLVAASCSGESSSDEGDSGGEACAFTLDLAGCAELHPPTFAYAERCEALWSGSVPCVSWAGCGAPMGPVLFVVSTACDGAPVDAWCCKDLQ